MNEIWNNGDMSKFAAAFGKLLHDITSTQGIGIESDNEWMECEEGGKKAFGKVWRVVYYNEGDMDTIAEYFEKTFIIGMKNRPVIFTADGNQVSLDGTQVCLVKRGNNVVS